MHNSDKICSGFETFEWTSIFGTFASNIKTTNNWNQFQKAAEEARKLNSSIEFRSMKLLDFTISIKFVSSLVYKSLQFSF